MNKQKILIFISILVFAASTVYAETIEVLNPSFEYVDGELILVEDMTATPDYWEFDSGNNDDGVTDTATEGYVCVAIGGIDSLYQLLDYTIGPGDEYTLMFDAHYLDTANNWDCTFEGRFYYDDAGSREVLGYIEVNLTDPQVWIRDYTCEVVVPLEGPAIGKKLGVEIAVTSTGSAKNHWVGFDNVRLDGVLAGSVKCINPPKDSELIPVETTLEWFPPSSYTPQYYDLYFGTDPNFSGPPVLSKQNQTTWDPPGDLYYNTVYYWRVDAYQDSTLREGTIWSFTTIPAWPVVLVQPVSVTASAEGSAELSVQALEADYYYWYKEGSSTPVASGEDMSTLSLTGLERGDEGYYYCLLENSRDTSESDRAFVWTRRLVGHWKFEDNLNDELGDWPGTYMTPVEAVLTPVFDSYGIEGKAMQFNDDPNHVRVLGSEDFFNFVVGGFSVSAWARITEEPIGWDVYLSRGFWIDVAGGGTSVAGLSGGGLFSSEAPFEDKDWHHTVLTYDPEIPMLSYFVDGVLNDQDGTQSAWEDTVPLVMGALGTDGAEAYNGFLDDVRIWSYAIDPVDIALLYTDFKPGEVVCVETPQYDYDEDCKVGITDLVVIVDQWLDCNIVPSCIQ